MADVAITTDSTATGQAYGDGRGIVFTSPLIGYHFYINATSNDVVYKKTTDGGATWGSEVTVRTGTCELISIWFDKWTPGDSGTKIHAACIDSAVDDVFYRDLDTSSDTLGTERTVFAGASYAVIGGPRLSITKAKGGNLYVYWNLDGGTEEGFYRSVDAGVNWTSRTNVGEGTNDVVHLFPANTADTQDICALYDDFSANALSIKMYDDSANTWTETAITTLVEVAPGTAAPQFQASVRHSDSHVILAAWNDHDSATADFLVYDITVDSIASPTITGKTNIVSNIDDSALAAVCINQNTDRIYVAYLGKLDSSEAFGSSVSCAYVYSDNGGTSWQAETVYSTTARDYVHVMVDLGGTSTLFAPVMIDTAEDIWINALNAVAISPSAAATIAAVLDEVTAALTATQTIPSTIVSLLDKLIFAGTAVMQPSGSIASTLDKLVAALSASQVYTGTIASTLRPVQSSFAVAQSYPLTIASTPTKVAAAFVATMQPSGVIASTLRPVSASLTAEQIYALTIAALLDRATSSLAVSQVYDAVIASVVDRVTAALTVSQAGNPEAVIGATLDEVVASLTVDQPFTTTIASTLRKVVAAAVASQSYPITIASTTDRVTAALNASQVYQATIATVIDEVVAALVAAQAQEASIDSDLDRVQSSLTSQQIYAATIAVLLTPMLASLLVNATTPSLALAYLRAIDTAIWRLGGIDERLQVQQAVDQVFRLIGWDEAIALAGGRDENIIRAYALYGGP